MLVLDHGELVDREPVVAGRVVEVEHANLSAANTAVRVDVLHRYADDEHPMEVAVPGLQRRPGRMEQAVQGVFECLVGNVGIEAGDRGPRTVCQDHHAVVSPLRGRHVRCDVRTMENRPAERCQPVEGDGFDGRFRDARWRHDFLSGVSRFLSIVAKDAFNVRVQQPPPLARAFEIARQDD